MKTNSGSNDSMRGNPPSAPGKHEEENSVTFSLSALMAQTGPSKSAKSAGAATKDDSGLIDLNALTAMEDGAAKSVSAPVGGVMPASSLGLFPFDSPSALTAAPAPVAQTVESVAPKKPSRSWLWIGGVGVAVAAVAAFFVGMNAGTGDQAQAAASATVETARSAVAVTAPEVAKAAEPQVAALDPGASKAAVKETPKETPKPVLKAPGGPAKPAIAKGEPPPGAAPKEERKGAPGDPCKGDLMCAMQRATKK